MVKLYKMEAPGVYFSMSHGPSIILCTFHSDQLFNVRQTVAFLSQGTTLEPGTIILTGTPKGVGFVRKPPVYLKHGDEVRVSLGNGIGTLVNPVVEEESAPKL
jgi:2-keto-4-pentenoate hydratase/2-oxohepta-3-ene-1,7-dioic acid hydratase in catechol pathway